MCFLRLRLKPNSRLLRTVLVMGTLYATFCIVAVISLFPGDLSVDINPEKHLSKVQTAQGEEAWHSLSKRGGRPRNIFYSSETQDENIGQREARRQSHSNGKHSNISRLNLPVVPPTSSQSSNEVPFDDPFRQTELEDVFIGVKTTKNYHESRIPVLFETWLDNKSVKKQTYFFTDTDESKYNKEMNGHFINTHCDNKHTLKDLCCKMGVIFSTYLKSGKRWWCNVDDDNYVNVDNLLKLLRSYEHNKDYYLGRSSTAAEIVVNDIGDKRNSSRVDRSQAKRQATFWFATGGAGVCISRPLALKMIPYAGFGEFPHVCDRINLPDDVSIGFLVVDLLGVQLTKVRNLHSHLVTLKHMNELQIKEAITLSYRIQSDKPANCITVKGAAFNTTHDPTRFKSLHCKLYPNAPICPIRTA